MIPLSTDALLERARASILRRVRRGFWEVDSALDSNDPSAELETGLHEWGHCSTLCRRSGRAPRPMDTIELGQKIGKLPTPEGDDQEAETIALVSAWLRLFRTPARRSDLIRYAVAGTDGIYTYGFMSHRVRYFLDMIDDGGALWRLVDGLWRKTK